PVRPPLQDNSTPVSGYTTDLTLQAGAAIVMDPGSTVKLSSANHLEVDGTISTPGGTISLNVSNVRQRPGLAPPGIDLGASALLLAAGWIESTLAGNGLVQRTVESGGRISISSLTGLQIDPGAVLDVSGVRGVSDLTAVSGGRFEARAVDGNGGS